MGQYRTLDADVTIGCYCGDYSNVTTTIRKSLFIKKNVFFSPTCLPFFFFNY